MDDLNAQEPLSNLSDSSFVILGQDSMSATLNEDSDGLKESLKADTLTDSKSTFSGFESVKSNVDDKLQNKWFKDGESVPKEEIQRKLDDVLKENCELKETLVQNNLAIKSQLDAFFMWQQDVLKTQETHKEKFLETKTLILKLLEENKSLKKQAEESLVSVSNVNKDASVQINNNSEESNELEEKIKQFERLCNDLVVSNEDLDMENRKLKEELKEEKQKLLKLNKELEDLIRENSFLKQSTDDVKKNSFECKSLPNAEARTQISNLLKQLDEEKGKVAKLKEELKEVKSSNTGVKKSATEELTEYIGRIDDMNNSLDNQNERFGSLLSWITLAEENLQEVKEGVGYNLTREIKVLKSHINQEEHICKEKQETLQELKSEFNRLLLDYQSLLLKFNEIKSNEPDTEKYKEEVLSLSVLLEEKNKELQMKEEECEKLKEGFSELAVMVMCQTDINEEKIAESRLLRVEKEDWKKQTQFLEDRILALETSIKEENDSLSSSSKKIWKCPHCLNSFSSTTREEHMRDCYFVYP